MERFASKNDTEIAVCACICAHTGLKAREIAALTGLERAEVNRLLYASPLLHELCWQDREYRWHGIVRQERPHAGLSEFSGFYDTAAGFMALTEEQWLARLREGCVNIGRNLNDTRGLIHSFRDCRRTVFDLFTDLRDMLGPAVDSWETVFELRLKRSRRVRIYADVLILTENRAFSLEFKMKDKIDPSEAAQAAKYAPYLEILLGPRYEIIPVLVLTAARELYTFTPIPGLDGVIPVCSGDMLFNVFDEYMGFLNR